MRIVLYKKHTNFEINLRDLVNLNSFMVSWNKEDYEEDPSHTTFSGQIDSEIYLPRKKFIGSMMNRMVDVLTTAFVFQESHENSLHYMGSLLNAMFMMGRAALTE